MNWREWFASIAPATLQGYYGERFVGVTALLFDVISQGATDAVRAPWLLEETSPDDVLALKGTEYLMPRYPNETADTYRQRLSAVWDTWPFAGSDQSIVGQLHAAGFPGAAIVCYDVPGPDETYPYWSQFWVVWTTESVRQEGSWGPFHSSGDSDIVTVDDDEADLIRTIVKKWKPSDWICRALVVDVSAATWGSFLWGDGTEWGGRIEEEF